MQAPLPASDAHYTAISPPPGMEADIEAARRCVSAFNTDNPSTFLKSLAPDAIELDPAASYSVQGRRQIAVTFWAVRRLFPGSKLEITRVRPDGHAGSGLGVDCNLIAPLEEESEQGPESGTEFGVDRIHLTVRGQRQHPSKPMRA